MCTIGAVFDDQGVHLFKQCDLTSKTTFHPPAVKFGRIPYIAMTRDGRPGLWAGMNQAGVCFVAADSYTNRTYQVEDADVNRLFTAYEQSVANGATARQAADMLQAFYLSDNGGQGFAAPDIAMHADATQAIFTEYTPGPQQHRAVREVVVKRGFFASTNHFRVQPDAVVYPANHSTYLRLARAETILEKTPTLDGVRAVLTDQYYGPSELSICRVAEFPGEYFTQATAVFSAGPAGLASEYQIGGNPLTNPLRPFDVAAALREVARAEPAPRAAASPFRHVADPTPLPPPEGFLYVDQANYAVVPLWGPEMPYKYLYSDSATSCIILIALGQDASGRWLAALAHVDSPDCIQSYFGDVLDRTFTGVVHFYAQGANPPDNDTSKQNAAALIASLGRRSAGGFSWEPDVRHLALMQGDPRRRDRAEYGVSLGDVPIVSNQPFHLTLPRRDPTCGAQVLFTIMRRHMTPPIQIRDALTPFEPALLAELVQIASTYQKDPDDPTTAFTYIINLEDDAVRSTWSSTPAYEAPWFSAELKQSCCYTLVQLARTTRSSA